MEKELLLLRKLHTNPELTQRDMAKAIGISLGSVNLLIKELVDRGILNVDKLTQKTRIYNLTSQGLKKKAESTYRYVVEAYAFIKAFSSRIYEILETVDKGKYIILFGEKDEIYEFVETKLSEKGTDYKFVCNIKELQEFSQVRELLVLVWHPEKIYLVKQINCNYIDLMDCI